MERLTLENAINRSRKLAERHRWNSENTKLETSDENANEVYKNTCILYANQEEQYAEWLEELKSYKDIGTPKELKELKENGAFTGLELAKLVIMQKELKKYKDLEEQGLLVRLPANNKEIYIISSRWTVCSECGSRFDEYSCSGCEYECDSKKEYYVYSIYLSSITVSTYVERFGKTVFLTREEAEKKLKEMKNGL
nr:MAG TPA: Putative iron uptake regulatory protein, nickel-uptake regulator, D-domain, dimerization [Caudoviricetes sp.]